MVAQISSCWKTAAALFLVGGFCGSSWTYWRYFDVPSRTLAALNTPRLEWQEEIPLPRAAGWLNGPAPTRESLIGRVVLVDVWADWCDPCVGSTPEMVKLYQRFKDRVIWVGLTAGDALSAREYVEQFGVEWPVGYRLSDETMRDFGGIGPLIFIIGRDGQIFWYDDRARLRHKDLKLWRRVAQELELALDEPF